MNAVTWGFTAFFVCAAAVLCTRYFFFTRMRLSNSALTTSNEYRSLAEEYRRLSDMAITANEHVDLRLTDLVVRMDELRNQLDRVQRILKEVE